MNHHPCGPSRLGLRKACPGSLAMEADAASKGLVIQESIEDAEMGIRCHSALPPDSPFPENDEEKKLVEEARSFISDYYSSEMSIEYEARIDSGIYFGTADVVMIDKAKKIGMVIDIKFGRNPLDNETISLQLKAYCAVLLDSVTTITAFVYQPATGTSFSAKYDDRTSILKEIQEIIDQTMVPDAPRRYGLHCRHCKAKSVCPEFVNESQLAHIPTTDVASMEMAHALDFAELASRWIPAIRAKAKKILQDGGSVPGWRLSVRTIREVELEKAWFLLDDVKSHDFLSACSVSVKSLEDLFHRIKGGERKANEKEFNERLKDAIVKVKQVYLRRE